MTVLCFDIGFFCCLFFWSPSACRHKFNVSFCDEHCRSKLRSRDIYFVNGDIVYWKLLYLPSGCKLNSNWCHPLVCVIYFFSVREKNPENVMRGWQNERAWTIDMKLIHCQNLRVSKELFVTCSITFLVWIRFYHYNYIFLYLQALTLFPPYKDKNGNLSENCKIEWMTMIGSS